MKFHQSFNEMAIRPYGRLSGPFNAGQLHEILDK